MANLAHNIGEMLAKLATKLGRKLTAKEILTLDKKAVSSLLSQKTTAEEAAKLLGKKKLSATEVKGFLKPAVSPAAKVEPKTKRTPTPKSVRAKGTKNVSESPQTTALAKRGETRMEAPVKTVKGDRVLTPQTTALAKRGGRVEAPSKTGTGRKLAAGAAVAAGLGIAASRNGQQGDRTQVESLNKKTSVGSTQSPENAAASGEVDAEAVAPSVTIPEAQFKKDVVDYVHTKGGDYPIFRRNSDSAMTWRNTYATAKKNGESTFTFNGLKYKV